MFYFGFLLSSFLGFAQTTELPSWDFGKDGLVVKHAPSHFTMKTRFRIQTRATYEDYDSESTSKVDTTDFTVRRMRLRFDGTALDPRFLYKVQLSFTRGDMDYDNTNYPNILRDAVVGWKLTDKNTLWFGQTKLPGNRQRVISSGNQELVDRSLLNATFNIDRDMGLQLHNQIGDESPLWIKLAISNGEGRANNNKNSGLSYTGRIEWLPFGKFTDDGDYFEGDLAREQDAKVSIGSSYNFNQKTNRLGGQIGKTFDTGLLRNMETVLVDFLVKYNGWAWSSEYARRWTNDPIVTIDSATESIFKGSGCSTQLSYVFTNQWSPVARYTRITPHDSILSVEDEVIQYTVGLTKYLNQHKIKLMGDVTLEDENNSQTLRDRQNWIARIQLEFGI